MSISERMEAKRHELFEDMVSRSIKLFDEFGIPAPAAELVANSLADEIAEAWGGQNLNMPKDYQRMLSQRDVEVYRKFDGSNQPELAREYGLTERGMYKLIKRIQERLRRQAMGRPDLFGGA